MNFILQNLLGLLLVYKYYALFTVTYLAALALPIPSAATVMASAAFAGEGYFSIVWVFIIATLGNILGDLSGYVLARRFGRQVLLKIGFKRLIQSDEFKSLEQIVLLHPGFIVFFSRFEVISTVSVNILAGLGRLKFKTYFFYELIGETFQIACYVALGWIFGNNWEAVSDIVGNFGILIFLLGAIVILIFWKNLIKRLLYKHQQSM